LGTSLSIYLPRYGGDAQVPERVPDSVTAEHAHDGETILVVDDDPAIRMLVTEVLDDLGYRVIEAQDGQAGLAVLESNRRIDLLITDVGLPGGLNGRQLADAARVLRPDLRIVFITGYAESAVVDSGQLTTGMHVIVKPFAMASLANRIASILGDR
jgi:CheY-like chemotaxis protein